MTDTINVRFIGGVVHSETHTMPMRDAAVVDIPFVEHDGMYRCRYWLHEFDGRHYLIDRTMDMIDARAWIDKWIQRERKMQ